jgi:hypothetical protein
MGWVGRKEHSERRTNPSSRGYTDPFRNYNALNVSLFHHVRIDHGRWFVDRHKHINDIENFWCPGQASPAAIQRHQARTLLLVSERVRMAFQRRQPPEVVQTA